VFNIVAGILSVNNNLGVVLFGRFLAGFSAIGASIVLLPKILEEIAPPQMKASLGALTQTFIILGVIT
jgi:hypothetical protein